MAIARDEVVWTCLGWYKDQWQAFVTTVTNQCVSDKVGGGEIPDCVSHYQLLKKDYVQFLGHAHDALAQLTYAFLVMAKSGHLRSYRRLRKFVYWIGLETTGNQISTPTYKEVGEM